MKRQASKKQRRRGEIPGAVAVVARCPNEPRRQGCRVGLLGVGDGDVLELVARGTVTPLAERGAQAHLGETAGDALRGHFPVPVVVTARERAALQDQTRTDATFAQDGGGELRSVASADPVAARGAVQESRHQLLTSTDEPSPDVGGPAVELRTDDDVAQEGRGGAHGVTAEADVASDEEPRPAVLEPTNQLDVAVVPEGPPAATEARSESRERRNVLRLQVLVHLQALGVDHDLAITVLAFRLEGLDLALGRELVDDRPELLGDVVLGQVLRTLDRMPSLGASELAQGLPCDVGTIIEIADASVDVVEPDERDPLLGHRHAVLVERLLAVVVEHRNVDLDHVEKSCQLVELAFDLADGVADLADGAAAGELVALDLGVVGADAGSGLTPEHLAITASDADIGADHLQAGQITEGRIRPIGELDLAGQRVLVPLAEHLDASALLGMGRALLPGFGFRHAFRDDRRRGVAGGRRGRGGDGRRGGRSRRWGRRRLLGERRIDDAREGDEDTEQRHGDSCEVLI